MSGFDLVGFNDAHEDYLGVTCWWTVSRNDIAVDDVVKALADCGLDEGLVKAPTSKRAFTRAARSIDKGSRNVFTRKIVDATDRSVLGIVRETRDASEEKLSYKQQVTASLNKESGRVTTYTDGNGGEKIAEVIKKRYTHYRDVITDADIRLLIRSVIRSINGVSLRPTGGIYFIPKSQVGTIVKLDEFLRRLGVGVMYIMRVPEGETERVVAWEGAEMEIRDRVEKILSATLRIEKRAKFIKNQEAKLVEVQRVFDLYQELTGEEERAENLREYIEDAGNQVVQKLAEIQNL